MARRHLTVREIKKDTFRETLLGWSARAQEYGAAHARALVYAGIGIAAIGGIALVFYGWRAAAHQKAARALAEATSPLVIPPVPAPGEMPAPGAETQAAQESLPKVEEVANRYPRTPAGMVALFYDGSLRLREGKAAEAKSSLEELVRRDGDHRLAAPARGLLADAAELEGNADEAERLWKELVQRDDPYLPTDSAQISLASFYERHAREKEALDLYDGIADDPESVWKPVAEARRKALRERLGVEEPKPEPPEAEGSAGGESPSAGGEAPAAAGESGTE